MNRTEQRERPTPPSLERILRHEEHELRDLAAPGIPLTLDRLRAVNEQLVEVVIQAEDENVGWPDAESAVPIAHEGTLAGLVATAPEQADARFVSQILAEETMDLRASGHRPGYNNFPAILRSVPVRPDGVDLGEFMADNPSAALYGSKPYLWRAHMLKPDFMRALNEEVTRHGGVYGWNTALQRAVSDPERHPEDATLLRASRLAYSMLANLMRDDDLRRQYEWLGLPSETTHDVTDPEEELWT